MQWSDEGLVLGARKHGESGVILELMTRGARAPSRPRARRALDDACSRCCSPATACRRRGGRGSTSISAAITVEGGELRAARSPRLAAGALRPRDARGRCLRLLPERDPHPALYDDGLPCSSTISTSRTWRRPSSCASSSRARRARLRPRSRQLRRDRRAATTSSTCRRKAGARSAPTPASPIRTRLLSRCRRSCAGDTVDSAEPRRDQGRLRADGVFPAPARLRAARAATARRSARVSSRSPLEQSET